MTMTMTTESEPVANDTASADNKKKIIAAGVLGALVLGYGGYTMLKGGDSGSEQAFAPIRHTPIARAKVAPVLKKAKPAKPAVVPAASAVKLGRDPFLALYRVPVAAAPSTSSSTPATSTGTTPTSTGTTSTSTSGGSTTPTSSPYALKLTSIKGTDAKLYTFNVAGTTKTVLAAQRFGKYGELVVLAFIKDAKGNPIGALIQVGDDDPVGIKVGEKITVL